MQLGCTAEGFVPPSVASRGLCHPSFSGAKTEVLSDETVRVQPNRPATCQGSVVSLYLGAPLKCVKWMDAVMHGPSDRSLPRSKGCKHTVALHF